MKTGRTLPELATEIRRQQATKRDYIVDTRNLTMLPLSEPTLAIQGSGRPDSGINKLAHGQIAERVGIPWRYYEKMLSDAPQLLTTNVNHWFSSNPEQRMVRTLDGRIRAFLSDRYRPLDYADLAEAALPALSDVGVDILSAEITEKRLYIKAVDQRIRKDVPKGAAMGDGSHQIFDTLCPAICLSDSEVGFGTLSLEVGVYTKACTNMALFSARSLRKYHLGGKHQLTEGFEELLSDKTKSLTDQAIWAQVGDVIKGAFDQARFEASVDEMVKPMLENKISNPVATIELAAKKFGLSETEKNSVLTHLIEGHDLSQYGLFSAVTRTGQDAEDYDRATDIERMGGQIIDLSRDGWRELQEAA